MIEGRVSSEAAVAFSTAAVATHHHLNNASVCRRQNNRDSRVGGSCKLLCTHSERTTCMNSGRQ